MQLVAACSGIPAEKLEARYRLEAEANDFSDNLFDEKDLPVLEEDVDAVEACEAELSEDRTETGFKSVLKEINEVAAAEANGEQEAADMPDPDLGLPDGEQLIALTSLDVSQDDQEPDKACKTMPLKTFPKTLSEAMCHDRI